VVNSESANGRTAIQPGENPLLAPLIESSFVAGRAKAGHETALRMAGRGRATSSEGRLYRLSRAAA
jgi:hypothetical protein